MNLTDFPESAIPLYIVAFSGEERALSNTLGRCRDEAQVVVSVIGNEDKALARVAESCDIPFISIALPETQENAYWSVLISALSAEADKCLVLRAGTELPEFWVQRLAAVFSEEMAALFPLSVRHPCTSIFLNPKHETNLDVKDIDRWLNRYVPGQDFDIPLFAGYTAMVRPRLFSAALHENDLALAQATRESGGLIVCTDKLYIDDSCFSPIPLPAQLFSAWKDSILQRHPLTGLRHSLTELSSRNEKPGLDVPEVLPVRLHLSHGWGGGLGRWVEDFMQADDSCHNYLLRPIGDYSAFGQTLALYSSSDTSVPLQSWTLTTPIVSTAVSHLEYRRLLEEIVSNYGVQSIMLSSLIGHSLDVFEIECDITVICHDFYPFCPPILATYGTPCSSCDSAQLSDCLENNPGHRFFLVEKYSHWKIIRKAYLDAILDQRIHLVAPSQSVVHRMTRLMPELEARKFTVIEHGLPGALLDQLSTVKRNYAGERRLKIVVLGSLESHKGSPLLQSVLEQLAPYCDFVLLGVGESGRRFGRHKNVELVERYDRSKLGYLLDEHGPDIGLLLSNVPETFSYTLSELMAASIPVAATRMGAFSDRIEHGVNGWLFEPESSALLDLLELLRDEPRMIFSAAETLRKQQPRDAREMVAAYNKNCSLDELARINRPLRCHHNSVQQKQDFLYIHPEATFAQVVENFVRYAKTKIQHTPRFPGYIKRPILAVLNMFHKN